MVFTHFCTASSGWKCRHHSHTQRQTWTRRFGFNCSSKPYAARIPRIHSQQLLSDAIDRQHSPACCSSDRGSLQMSSFNLGASPFQISRARSRSCAQRKGKKGEKNETQMQAKGKSVHKAARDVQNFMAKSRSCVGKYQKCAHSRASAFVQLLCSSNHLLTIQACPPPTHRVSHTPPQAAAGWRRLVAGPCQ